MTKYLSTEKTRAILPIARILFLITSFLAAAEAARNHCKQIRQHFDTVLFYTLTASQTVYGHVTIQTVYSLLLLC